MYFDDICYLFFKVCNALKKRATTLSEANKLPRSAALLIYCLFN